MANLRSRIQTNELMVLVLFAILFCIAVSNYFGEHAASAMYNVLNMLITGSLVFFSILQISRNGHKSQIGKAWICFSTFVILWFVAEVIWLAHEITYNAIVWPSEADYFWIAGYPAYFVFSAYYLRPFKALVSKNIIFIASIVTAVVLILSLHISELGQADFSDPEVILGLAYPVADAISLFPITIGLILFFRGQVNFLWSMLLIGMLCFVVSDMGFLILIMDDTYYSGHPIDTVYLWAYAFLLFGAYSQLHVFKKRNSENRFNHQESLR